jgi:UDP-3-O-[3-hydroxymyristoyl] glucosamine N-acyltransferase
MINDTTKPLVFIGTNVCIWEVVDAAKAIGYEIAGVIDNDYHGRGEFQSLPIIAREEDLVDAKWKDYQFFCATNWQPDNVLENIHQRNRDKRQKYIKLLDELDLSVATIVHPMASVASYNTKLGKGVYIDKFVCVGSNCTIGNYTTLWNQSALAHDNTVGNNCVLQRCVNVSGDITIEDNVYLGVSCCVFRDNVTIASGTFVHPGLMLLRSTEPNEVVSLAGKDLRKVYKRRGSELT